MFKSSYNLNLRHSLELGLVTNFGSKLCSDLCPIYYYFQIEYDDRAKASPLKEQPKQAPKPTPAQDDDEDDLDIDAI